MFGSEVLEVVIGLVFIFLTLSLLTTAVNELVARAFALRSGTLVDGISGLVKDPDKFYKHPLIKALSPVGLSLGIGKGRGKPSYIDPKIFAVAALDTLSQKVDNNGKIIDEAKYILEVRTAIDQLPDEFKRPLLLAMADAQNDVVAVKEQFEKSFNEIMKRVNGWYKRKLQLISIVVGLLVAIVANADSISITNALLRDATLRDAIVASVEQSATRAEADLSTDINELQEQLLQTQILGWITASEDSPAGQTNTKLDPRAMPARDDYYGWGLKVFGWFVTAFAISLGAPFWFDVLGKVMAVRATGKPTQDEPPKPNVRLTIN